MRYLQAKLWENMPLIMLPEMCVIFKNLAYIHSILE